ncbi:BspA family leucine-rich repeat surface protein [Aquimarina algiphila]|uniref:BspA family leucine-rich repeat surface protein n=1 Tax=Aquimarina algiphila TaxID=2047982 RepID=UPI003B967C26
MDYSNPVKFTVTAEDGTTKEYTITVTVLSAASTEKSITKFTTTEGIDGVIDESSKTIVVSLPSGTSKTGLKATAVISDKASISPDPTLATDYSKPVEFTVTAEDGTTQEYTVTVTVETANEGKPFVTTWETTTENEDIVLPTADQYKYKYTIDWGDGTVTTDTSGYGIHTYSKPGKYQVKIFGDFPMFHRRRMGSVLSVNEQIISIDSWGDIQWKSMENAFAHCPKLIYKATDSPDLSNVTSMKSMFSMATSFNGDISKWDVSNVENMENMFSGATSFNGDISKWNVSNVEYMADMFFGATNFNQDIGGWNVSNVTDMASMFGNTSFNQDIGDWNVSNVTNMESMFSGAKNFNQDIGDWNVSNVTNMYTMFFGAKNFNQDIGDWNVSNVTNMGQMFEGVRYFNGDIGNWNVSNVTNMWGMFYGAGTFNKDIGDWNVSNVKNMSNMFRGASNFNKDIGNWNVSNVEYMVGMFFGAINFNQDIGGWNVSSVISMRNMFARAFRFDQNIGNWNVSNVKNMRDMFEHAKLTYINYEALLIGWEKNGVSKDVEFHGGKSIYKSQAAVQARERLINDNNWDIKDGGKK